MGSLFEVIGSDGRLHLSSGTTALPIISFIGDTDTGLSRTGSDALALSTGGASRLTIDSGGTVQTQGQFEVQVPASNRKIIDGTGYWLEINKQYGMQAVGSEVHLKVATNSTLQAGIAALVIAPLSSPTTTFNSSGITLASGILSVASTSNQIALSGPTRQVIINAPQPATASRTMTIPDVGSNSSFLLTDGPQTVNKVLTWNTGALYAFTGSLSAPGFALNGTDKTSGFTGGGGGHNIVMVANQKNAIEADGDSNTVVVGPLFDMGVGGSPVTNGILTINSTTKAFVPPRMTTTQRDAITSPSAGMELFNTTTGVPEYYNGTLWQAVGSGAGVSYPLLAPDGSLAAPSYSFTNEPDCGLVRLGTNSVIMATNGARSMVWNPVVIQFWIGGTSLMGQVSSLGIGLGQGHFYTDAANPGTAATPAFEVGGTTTSKGLYEIGSNILGISTNSTEAIRIDAVQNVGIGGSTVTNGLLTLSSTTRAFVPPRMTQTQRDAITSPSAGMLVYNTTTSLMSFYNGSTWSDMAAGGVSYPLLAPAGSAAAPSYSWSADSDSGFYSITGGQFAASADNAIATIFTNTGLETTSGGTAGHPSYTFAGDTDNGMYRIGANNIGFSTGGTQRLSLTTTSLQYSVDCTPVTDITNDNGNSTHRWLNIWGQTLHSGDIELENKWRITEGEKVGHPEEGVMFVSPEGKKFKIAMTEVE